MKKLFIRQTNQPLALEVLGYVLCVLVGYLTLKTLGYKHWETYVWMAILVTGIGAIYRLLVAYTKELVQFVEKVYERITTFLCRLAGKRGNLIPRERTRYAVQGGSLFVPVLMAFYTFPYLLQTTMGIPVNSTYAATIPLAIIIFIVDRVFITTMGWKKLWYIVLFRLALATVLGVYLAKPIELRQFQKETTEELSVQRRQNLAKIEKEHENALLDLKAREDREGAELKRAREEYEKETNTSIGGRPPGHGPEAEKKERYFKDQQDLYAKNVAPRIERERATIEADFEQKKAEYTNTQSDGLGARAQALDNAGKKYPAVKFISWLLMLALVLVDLSPIIAKILMPKSQSDRAEQAEEEETEHKNELTKVDRKYELMSKELKSAVDMINALDLPQGSKDHLLNHQRLLIQRKHFGEESLRNVPVDPILN